MSSQTKKIIIVLIIIVTIPFLLPNGVFLYFKNMINKNKLPENNDILFGDKIPTQYRIDFVSQVKNLAVSLDVNVNWLMFIMDFESAGTFSPSITNKFGYVGLIQFGVLAASDLGTSTTQLKMMNVLEQLVYVDRYFKRWGKYSGGYKSFIDLYMAVLYPAAIGKPDSYLFTPTFSKNNPVLDLNKDAIITKGEILNSLKAWIRVNVPVNYWIYFDVK